MLFDDHAGDAEDGGAVVDAGDAVAEAELGGGFAEGLAADVGEDLVQEVLAGDGEAGVEDDQGRVEEVDEIGDAEAEVAGDFGGDVHGDFVAAGSGFKDEPAIVIRVEIAFSAFGKNAADAGFDGTEAGDGFETAKGAAGADGAVIGDAGVAELAGGGALAVEESAIDVEAGADAGAVVDVDHAGGAGFGGFGLVFGEGFGAGTGFEEDGEGEFAGEDFAEGDVGPVGEGGAGEGDPVAAIDEAGVGDTDAHGLDLGLFDGLFRDGEELAEKGFAGGGALCGGGKEGLDFGFEVGDAGGDGFVVELEADDGAAVGVELEEDAFAAEPGGFRACLETGFDEAAIGEEFADEFGGGREADAGERVDGGAGERAVLAEERFDGLFVAIGFCRHRFQGTPFFRISERMVG